MELASNAAEDWEKLRTWTMPFGKSSGRKLYDLPAEYLCCFEQKGWPSGDPGRLLQTELEAKRQGPDPRLHPLSKQPAAKFSGFSPPFSVKPSTAPTHLART